MTHTFFSKAFKGQNQWWRYLIMIIAIFLATQLGSFPLAMVASIKVITDGIELNTSTLTTFKLLGIDPNIGLMLLALTFVTGMLAYILLFKPLHHRKVIDSITGRNAFDWKRFFFAVFIWGSFMIISFFIGYMSNPGNFVLQFDPGKFIVLIFVSVVFIGIQSTFEEVVFRGYFMQGLGVLFKNAWIPVILTSVVFGLMHYANPEVTKFGAAILLPQYILLGLVFAVTVVMDEGLEIAIGVHVANNVLTSLLVTHESSVLKTTAIFSAKEIDPVYSLYELIITSALFLAIMAYKYKWSNIKKLFIRLKPEIIEK